MVVQEINPHLQVVGEPAVLVGNSLGGYAAMATAASHPDLVCLHCLVFRGAHVDEEFARTLDTSVCECGVYWHNVCLVTSGVALYVVYKKKIRCRWNETSTAPGRSKISISLKHVLLSRDSAACMHAGARRGARQRRR